MRIADILPDPDRWSRHVITVDAAPGRTVEAACAVTPGEIRLFRPLMVARALPALVAGRRVSMDSDEPVLDLAARVGFRRLVDERTEVVIAHAGRYWRPGGGLHRGFASLDEFLAFDEPGWVKLAAGFHAVAGNGGGSQLVTETRVRATNAAARTAFGAYWLMINRPAGWIRNGWLRAARRRAESGPA